MKGLFIQGSLIVVLSLVLTGCGGGSVASTRIESKMTEYSYDPAVYVIPAGQEITLKVSDIGAADHEFVIIKNGLSIGDAFGPEDEEKIYWEVELKSGETKTVSFTAPEGTGEYQIVCGTEGHVEHGMIGQLIVVPSK